MNASSGSGEWPKVSLRSFIWPAVFCIAQGLSNENPVDRRVREPPGHSMNRNQSPRSAVGWPATPSSPGNGPSMQQPPATDSRHRTNRARPPCPMLPAHTVCVQGRFSRVQNAELVRQGRTIHRPNPACRGGTLQDCAGLAGLSTLPVDKTLPVRSLWMHVETSFGSRSRRAVGISFGHIQARRGIRDARPSPGPQLRRAWA